MPAIKNPTGTIRATGPAQPDAPPGEVVREDPTELPEAVRRFLMLSPGAKIRVGERWKRELLALRRMR